MIFRSRQIFSSYDLPFTIISMEYWYFVKVNGKDAEKYLQSQVTADIKKMDYDKHILCGHCNAKGKMWSQLRFFHTMEENFSYIARSSVLEIQLSEMKKYTMYSKVKIYYEENYVLLSVAGFNARDALSKNFSNCPDSLHPVVQTGETTILYFNVLQSHRFLLVTTSEIGQKLSKNFYYTSEKNNSKQWLSLDMETGYPVMNDANIAKFIPQDTNMQEMKGSISFSKGCYLGQEMVARAKFRGTNKNALYFLEGKASRVPESGEQIEWNLFSNWRRTGTVFEAICLVDYRLWVQVVMKRDIKKESVLRVRDDYNSLLVMKQLNYFLE